MIKEQNTDEYFNDLKEFFDSDGWVREFSELERSGLKISNFRRYLEYKRRFYLYLVLALILYFSAGLYVGCLIFM